MSEPKTLKDVIGRLTAGFEAMAAWQKTPSGRVARVQYDASLATKRAAELDSLADLRGVPSGRAIRSLALRPDLSGKLLEDVRATIAWGERNRCGWVLCLSGIAGCGKSTALAWTVTQCTARASYRYASDAARALPARFGEELARAEDIRNVPLLALDEAGLEDDPSQLAELLIRRVNDGRGTLLATNLDPETMSARYLTDPRGAGRLSSRLAGQELAGLPWIVVSEHADRRLGGA